MNGINDTLDLEQAIQELWKNIFEVNYLKPINLQKLGNLYILRLVIGNVEEKPIYINIECESDEQFLIMLTNELRSRRLQYDWYFTLTKLTDCQENENEQKF